MTRYYDALLWRDLGQRILRHDEVVKVQGKLLELHLGGVDSGT